MDTVVPCGSICNREKQKTAQISFPRRVAGLMLVRRRAGVSFPKKKPTQTGEPGPPGMVLRKGCVGCLTRCDSIYTPSSKDTTAARENSAAEVRVREKTGSRERVPGPGSVLPRGRHTAAKLSRLRPPRWLWESCWEASELLSQPPVNLQPFHIKSLFSTSATNITQSYLVWGRRRNKYVCPSARQSPENVPLCRDTRNRDGDVTAARAPLCSIWPQT